MKYKELKEILNGLNDGQLDKEVLIWSTDDGVFYDGVEYTHNPNNSFKQGCCYPLL